MSGNESIVFAPMSSGGMILLRSLPLSSDRFAILRNLFERVYFFFMADEGVEIGSGLDFRSSSARNIIICFFWPFRQTLL